MTPAALRRLTHAGTACILIPSFVLAWPTFRIAVIATTVGWFAMEAVRIRVPAAHAVFSTFVPVYREHEASRVSGAGWLMLGYAVAVWFPPSAATAGILVTALADPCASMVGTRFGDGTAKTFAGSLAFFVVTSLVLLGLGLDWPAVLVIALAGAIIERWPLGLNDNLFLPPAVASLVWWLA